MFDIENGLVRSGSEAEGDFESMREQVSGHVTEDVDEIADSMLAMLEARRDQRERAKLNQLRVASEPLPDEGIFVEAINTDGMYGYVIRLMDMKGNLLHAQESQFDNAYSATAEAVLVGMKRTGGETVFVSSGKPMLWLRTLKEFKDPKLAEQVDSIMTEAMTHQSETGAKLRTWNTKAWGEPATIPENLLMEAVDEYNELMVANGQSRPSFKSLRAF